MPWSPARVLIADDHVLIAELCGKLLAEEFLIVGIVNDGRAMVRMSEETKPDVIVADIFMPLLNGLAAGEQVKQICPAVKLVFLTMNNEVELAAEAFRRGASGYLLKTCLTSELITAVHAALCGKAYMSRTIRKAMTDRLDKSQDESIEPHEPLTPREQEVLQLVAEGRQMKAIADILQVTYRTVVFHKCRLQKKLGVNGNAAIVRYALRHHIVA